MTNSELLFQKAKNFIPGGVNSPVRAFRAVGGHPIFIKSAKGAYLHDEDGNSYIELINSWGPMILGHAHELVEKAKCDDITRVVICFLLRHNLVRGFSTLNNPGLITNSNWSKLKSSCV